MAATQQNSYGQIANYNASPGTRADGQSSALEVSNKGYLLVTPAPGASFGASSADGSAFTQNSTTGGISMGVYLASPQTLTTEQVGAIAVDVNRNTMVTEATLLAGENLTTNRLNVEPIYSYVNALADTAVKSGAGTLHSITLTSDAAATAGTIIFYDNTAESGTVIFTITVPAAYITPVTLILDVSFATGLYMGMTTTNDVSVTVAYR